MSKKATVGWHVNDRKKEVDTLNLQKILVNAGGIEPSIYTFRKDDAILKA
jgi:hypothetical protein